MLRNRDFWLVVASGLLLGVLGVMLSVWGNPENSGICVSCFIENSAGALGLHDNQRMQYLRPELIGFVLGSFLSALIFRDFRSRGGSAPLSRLFLGMFMIFGCAVFIGCPIKLLLRLTAGDLTSVAGVAGLVAGVWAGLKGLAHGVEFVPQSSGKANGSLLIPGLFLLLLVFFVVRPGFLLFSSQGGGGSICPLADSADCRAWLGSIGPTEPILHYRKYSQFHADGSQGACPVGTSGICGSGFGCKPDIGPV